MNQDEELNAACRELAEILGYEPGTDGTVNAPLPPALIREGIAEIKKYYFLLDGE